MKGFFAILLCAGVIFGMYSFSPYKESRQVTEVGVILPEVSGIYDSVTLRGTVIERGREELFPDYPSVIEELYVTLGQTVEAGQLLMTLKPLQTKNEAGSALFSDLNRGISSLYEGGIPDSIDDQSRQAAAVMAASLLQSIDVAGEEEQLQYVWSTGGGIVMSLAGEKGDNISGLLPCAVVSDMNKLAIQAEIAEDYVSRVKTDMPCLITISAMDFSTRGKVGKIMPYARKTGLFSQTSQVLTQMAVEFDEPHPELRPGYSVNLKVITETKSDALLLPYHVISADQKNREYVMVVGEDNRAEMRYIRTGFELNDTVEVMSGLDRNDRVIETPEAVSHGTRISVK